MATIKQISHPGFLINRTKSLKIKGLRKASLGIAAVAMSLLPLTSTMAAHTPGSATAKRTALPSPALNNKAMNDVSFFTTGDGRRIAYRLDGATDKPVLILSNSIATNLHMWDGQIAHLAKHFRVLRYDTRGHGASDAPAEPYSLARLGWDVIELMDELKIERAHFLGLSLGGIIAQWVAVHRPERIDKLILVNTSSYLGPAPQWDALIRSVHEAKDMTTFADMFMKNWFPQHMLENQKALVGQFRAMVLATKPDGLAGAFAAVRDADMRRTVALITSPTLVIAGKHDTVTLANHGQLLASTIPHAQYVELPAVHMSNVEHPERFLKEVTSFLIGK